MTIAMNIFYPLIFTSLLFSCQNDNQENIEVDDSLDVETVQNENPILEMKSIEELINKEDPGWPFVMQWKEEASNNIEILEKNDKRADSALFEAQVTTRSTMGAIIYESGGILIDSGWIRILGSGHERLERELMEWNKGKSYDEIGQQPSFLLVADDAIGGFFAINNGGISEENLGGVFYLSPDGLEWENLELSYSDFIVFCFSGDLELFYSGLKWKSWKDDLATLNGNQGVHFSPYLFTEEGSDIELVSKKNVPILELWREKMQFLVE